MLLSVSSIPVSLLGMVPDHRPLGTYVVRCVVEGLLAEQQGLARSDVVQLHHVADVAFFFLLHLVSAVVRVVKSMTWRYQR